MSTHAQANSSDAGIAFAQTASAPASRDYTMPALILGLVGTAIALLGFFTGLSAGDSRPLFSWLIGLSFWLSIAIGMLFMTLIFYIFHAKWPTVLRRQLEHGIGLFPLLAVLFVPLLIVPFIHDDPGILWKWMNAERAIVGGGSVATDPLFLHKSAYLNIPFFVGRVVFIFAVFAILGYVLRRLSFRMDQTGAIANFHRARIFSAVGIFFCAAAVTIAAIDWFKALEYHWFSTMYGVWFFAASMRAALSVTLILIVVLAARGVLKGLFNQAHRYDLACLMFAFTVFWAYISFSQYFLIYNANIPEVTFWYNIREKNFDGSLNSWWWVSLSLIFLHFLVPFLYLLFYKNKVTAKRTVIIAVWILLFHLLDIYFNILPGKLPLENPAELGYVVRQFSVTFYDIAALAGIGGLCIWSYLRSMKRVAPLPIRDPNISASLAHHE
jgi:hypothetical protein